MELIGQDIALREMVCESRDEIATRVGFDLKPTHEIRLAHEGIQRRHAGSFDLLTRGT
jgi:hypothetical protein